MDSFREVIGDIVKIIFKWRDKGEEFIIIKDSNLVFLCGMKMFLEDFILKGFYFVF